MARLCPQYHAQQCEEQDRRFWLVSWTTCSHSPVSVEVVGSSRAWISATYEMVPSLIPCTNLSGDSTGVPPWRQRFLHTAVCSCPKCFYLDSWLHLLIQSTVSFGIAFHCRLGENRSDCEQIGPGDGSSDCQPRRRTIAAASRSASCGRIIDSRSRFRWHIS